MKRYLLLIYLLVSFETGHSAKTVLTVRRPLTRGVTVYTPKTRYEYLVDSLKKIDMWHPDPVPAHRKRKRK